MQRPSWIFPSHAIVLAIILNACIGCSSEETSVLSTEISEESTPAVALPQMEMADVFGMDQPLTPALVEVLLLQTTVGSPEVQAAAAVVLYRHDAEAHWPQLFEAFTIRDYVDREAGIYHFIPVEEMGDKVNEIEARRPRDDFYPAPVFIDTFLHYRDLNQWCETDKNPRLSIARFFRGALFGNLLGAEAAKEAANRIDAETKAAMLSK